MCLGHQAVISQRLDSLFRCRAHRRAINRGAWATKFCGPSTPYYSVTPSTSATVKMSLSPRPDRLTRMVWSLRMLGASRSASATAWALSRAGIIPSVLESVWKAASACWSSIAVSYTHLCTRDAEKPSGSGSSFSSSIHTNAYCPCE